MKKILIAAAAAVLALFSVLTLLVGINVGWERAAEVAVVLVSAMVGGAIGTGAVYCFAIRKLDARN